MRSTAPRFNTSWYATVADARGVDDLYLFGRLGGVVLDVFEGVPLREPGAGEDDGLDVEAFQDRGQLLEELVAAAGVLALAGRAGDRGALLDAVLGDGVDVGLALLDGRDGDVRLLGALDGLLEPFELIDLPDLLDRDLVVFLDVERVMEVELVLPRTGGDLAADAEPVCELRELDVLDLEFDPHRLALTAGVPRHVVVALDAAGRVARDGVAGFENVGEMPQIVEALRDDGDPFAASLRPLAVGDAHAGSPSGSGKCARVRADGGPGVTSSGPVLVVVRGDGGAETAAEGLRPVFGIVGRFTLRVDGRRLRFRVALGAYERRLRARPVAAVAGHGTSAPEVSRRTRLRVRPRHRRPERPVVGIAPFVRRGNRLEAERRPDALPVTVPNPDGDDELQEEPDHEHPKQVRDREQQQLQAERHPPRGGVVLGKRARDDGPWLEGHPRLVGVGKAGDGDRQHVERAEGVHERDDGRDPRTETAAVVAAAGTARSSSAAERSVPSALTAISGPSTTAPGSRYATAIPTAIRPSRRSRGTFPNRGGVGRSRPIVVRTTRT